VFCRSSRRYSSREPKGIRSKRGKKRTKRTQSKGYRSFIWIGVFSRVSRFPPPGPTAQGESRVSTPAGMKYNYQAPVSTSTRSSQYTPAYQTPTYHTASHYTPSTPHYTSAYTSAYTSPTKYTPTKHTPAQYSSTHYTPSQYTSTYKAVSSYVPSYSKGSRYSSTPRTPAQEKPAPVAPVIPVIPVIPVAPAKRTVHFPNDIIFQDIVRRGDLEQIGRFMRARKVRVDTIFHSGLSPLLSLSYYIVQPFFFFLI